MSNVVHLHRPPPQIAHYLRIGYREHVLGDRMRAEGRFAEQGFVFDACHFETQEDLIQDLRAESCELILDTNIAEQSVLGRFSGTVANAPWARKDSPLEAEDFQAGTNRSVLEPIARFTVAKRFHTILSPTHYLGGNQLFWFDVDCRSCQALRDALDREGGQHIGINYALILDNAQIKDVELIKKIVAALQGLPISALWLRVAGFGADATGAGVDKMARSVLHFHDLGIPIIMDRLGGQTALALSSLGVTSGYTNGMKGKDGFQTGGWLKPRGGGGGGNDRAVFVSGLDRRVTVKEMKELFDASATARSVYGCRDTGCCSNIDAMLREPEAHHLREQQKTLADLGQVPEALRPDYYLDNHLDPMRLKAERSAWLKKAPEDFTKKAEKATLRLTRMKTALERTFQNIGQIPFAPEATVPSSVAAPGITSRNRP
ncbi:hypothetical protein [uncultured Tateyamaria sp.]|uniref:hypothetical protein n=1 Tax=uncultured Tateyamaria sp. TaxID=455651 RepID=UPI0026027558|nr:hypothetical protein [uncultured Tateyamaria sp.]